MKLPQIIVILHFFSSAGLTNIWLQGWRYLALFLSGNSYQDTTDVRRKVVKLMLFVALTEGQGKEEQSSSLSLRGFSPFLCQMSKSLPAVSLRPLSLQLSTKAISTANTGITRDPCLFSLIYDSITNTNDDKQCPNQHPGQWDYEEVPFQFVLLSHYTPWRRLGERRYSSYSFTTSALDGG
jgi:hypothetical protein